MLGNDQRRSHRRGDAELPLEVDRVRIYEEETLPSIRGLGRKMKSSSEKEAA